jgi:hypothetical protein
MAEQHGMYTPLHKKIDQDIHSCVEIYAKEIIFLNYKTYKPETLHVNNYMVPKFCKNKFWFCVHQ